MINKHLSYYRNFISEENAKQDFDKDPFKDAFDMKCKNFSHFIQFLPTKLEVHLWNREHISLLVNNIKKDTLHLGASGCVVQRMKYVEKRILLYSMVAHIPEYNMVYPVAHAILSNHFTYDIVRFLSELNRCCKVYKLKLPICKRIITDLSMAIIQAILNEFIDSDIIAYNTMCFRFLYGESDIFPSVCVQFGTSHYAKIMSI